MLVFTIAIINAVLGVGAGALLCSGVRPHPNFRPCSFMPVVIAPQLPCCVRHHRAA